MPEPWALSVCHSALHPISNVNCENCAGKQEWIASNVTTHKIRSSLHILYFQNVFCIRLRQAFSIRFWMNMNWLFRVCDILGHIFIYFVFVGSFVWCIHSMSFTFFKRETQRWCEYARMGQKEREEDREKLHKEDEQFDFDVLHKCGILAAWWRGQCADGWCWCSIIITYYEYLRRNEAKCETRENIELENTNATGINVN